MTADASLDTSEIPFLCPCGHDKAYHYRTGKFLGYRRNDDGTQGAPVYEQEACTSCTCPKYGTHPSSTNPLSGFGGLAPKEWGNR